MPACAGLLSSLGLGFIIQIKYLLPLTILLLAFSVGSLAFRAKLRRGYKPFWLGLFSAVVIILGKFVFKTNIMMYTGIVLLIAASIWNSWRLKGCTLTGGTDQCCRE